MPEHPLQHKRLAHVAMDITSQVATLSRVTALMNAGGVEGTATERFIAETYCHRAADRVERNLEQLERNDDDAMRQIARLTYRRGGSGYELYGS